MGNMFSLDSKMYKIGAVLADFIGAGLLWILFSLPLVTMGATTTALYYAWTKKSSGQDDFVLRNFWKGFKGNFLKSTLMFLVLVAVAAVLWINLFILGQQDLGWVTAPVTFALYFVLIQTVFVAIYGFCILARFEMTVFGTLRAALFLSYRYFPTTVGLVVLLGLVVLGAILIPELIVFLIGSYICLSAALFVKVFRRHDPEFKG